PVLFLTMIFAQVKEFKHISMPWLQVYGKGALALSSALVHISGGVVKHAQHRHKAITGTVGATNIAACGAHIMYGQPYATSTLRYFSSLLQRIVYAIYTVILHRQQEAGR